MIDRHRRLKTSIVRARVQARLDGSSQRSPKTIDGDRSIRSWPIQIAGIRRVRSLTDNSYTKVIIMPNNAIYVFVCRQCRSDWSIGSDSSSILSTPSKIMQNQTREKEKKKIGTITRRRAGKSRERDVYEALMCRVTLPSHRNDLYFVSFCFQ